MHMRLEPHPSLSSSLSLSPLVVAAVAVAVAVGVVQVVVDVDVDAVVVVDVDVTCCSHDLLVRNPLNPCHGYGFFQGCDLLTRTRTRTYTRTRTHTYTRNPCGFVNPSHSLVTVPSQLSLLFLSIRPRNRMLKLS